MYIYIRSIMVIKNVLENSKQKLQDKSQSQYETLDYRKRKIYNLTVY